MQAGRKQKIEFVTIRKKVIIPGRGWIRCEKYGIGLNKIHNLNALTWAGIFVKMSWKRE
jgi:hypothetical protein